MVNFILNKIIGTQNKRELKRLWPAVNKINNLEPQISKLTDAQLSAKTDEFKARLYDNIKKYVAEFKDLELALRESAQIEEKDKIKAKLKNINQVIFEDILAEAFAVVREAGKRTINMRHFDVQLVGGIVLHQGKIAEMATGEGKTLVATLAAYLNALSGRGVHIITVNDYLAKRDHEWMGPIYESLGLTVGAIQHDMDALQRRAAYNCDITYGTNNEFGFDYLRDNMVVDKQDMVQRPFYYAIVDEVDSILIDEARTPLIISGPAEESTEKYFQVDRIVSRLKGRIILEKDEIEAKYKGEDLSRGFDYIVDEKSQTAHLTEEGEKKACEILGLEDIHSIETMEYRHHIIQALRAHNLFKGDVDYVVKDGQVLIVDEFTGRLMPGRRWSDGLHQAIEAKEGLKIERENQTLATITFQNYFRMYEKLAGMTGTAATEAQEFKEIYKLDCIVIPTNQPLIRTNYPDSIYKTVKEKFNAAVEEIAHWYNLGRPVLVGTISIEKSERLSEMLKRRGVIHQVLNAKYHEQEAQIVAQAGRFKAITIATNMAGRGTDILLGGNPEYMAKNFLKVKGLTYKDETFESEYRRLLIDFLKQTEEEHKKVVELGGLHVIGTERHEARRIDNQLRGRAGRQGDPGSSRFYVSLEDDLMRLFGSDRLIGIMNHFGMEEGQVIEHPWVTKSIAVAQKRVEAHNFEIRKQLLEYDNVMNKQRELIYTQRRMILEGLYLKDYIFGMVEDVLDEALSRYSPEGSSTLALDWEGLENWLKAKFDLYLTKDDLNSLKDKKIEVIKDFIHKEIANIYEKREQAFKEGLQQLEQMVSLQIIDTKWKDHLYTMDNLREGIGLRAYGQRDPLVEYQREAFSMFSEMVESIKDQIVESFFKIQLLHRDKIKGVFVSLPQDFLHPELARFQKPALEPSELPFAIPSKPLSAPSPNLKSTSAVGRNEPCPCGSGKKFKKCCGR